MTLIGSFVAIALALPFGLQSSPGASAPAVEATEACASRCNPSLNSICCNPNNESCTVDYALREAFRETEDG